jgi:UDP-N-acetylmuramoyl-L-alanyl-D-glutamate--2,6-diaminopimelate ligase
VIIGVTGTNGKTTTSYFLAKALEADGAKTGMTSTALLKVADREWLNKTKMTMPGRFFLQRMLSDMVAVGCRYAVIETSSQGLIQHRHVGIHYDAVAYTNLTPEHIEAHGGFEPYKRAKRILFAYLARLSQKVLEGKPVPRFAVLNADDPYAAYFAATPGLPRVLWYSAKGTKGLGASDLQLRSDGSSFVVDGVKVELRLPGAYNVENALAALATCRELGVDLRKAAAKLGEIRRVPGRFDRIDAGQPWTVIVDYAPEPESFRRLYETLALLPHKRAIHVLGSCGGGRDVARRAVLGRLAAERADIVMVTNEDPYDDDPMEIIHDVASGARDAGKILGENLFEILDRNEAIRKAMRLAEAGDLVVLTGKGCEPWICLANGKKAPWDEFAAAREAITLALRERPRAR